MHQCTLPQFRGPIDLLVLLVERRELEASQMPLYGLLEQVAPLQLGLEGMVAIAHMARLVYLKARALLPIVVEEELPTSDDELSSDAPETFFQNIVEYVMLKQLSEQLSDREEEGTQLYGRGCDEPVTPPPMRLLVSLDDLTAAFQRLLSTPRLLVGTELFTVDEKLRWLRLVLKGTRRSFASLFAASDSRQEMVAIFLALLQLMKTEEVVITTDLYVEGI